MFDFFKPVHRMSTLDWGAIKKLLTDFAEKLGERLREHDRELERLANEVRRQEAEIALLKSQANHRQSFAQKLREKGKA